MGILANKSSKRPWQVARNEKEKTLLSQTLHVSKWRQKDYLKLTDALSELEMEGKTVI